jgi:AcrR family transcriptional regulator
MLADTRVRSDGSPKLRLSGAERRAAIVSAAMSLFAKNGFRGTTTREIACAVGVSEPVLYQHFATKRDLYTAIVDQMVAEAGSGFEAALAQADESAEPVEFLNWLGDTIVDWYVNRSEHIRLLFYSALEGHELAELWHEKATTPFLKVVEQAIARRKEQGLFRELDPFIAAKAFIGMVAHYALTTTIFRMPAAGMTIREAVRGFTQIYVDGLRPRPLEGKSE